MKYYGKQIQKHPTVISGSTLTVDLGANSGSTAIITDNVTVGFPTANRWQDNLVGSYFNTFDHNSNVSEVLRFMAGVISHSIDTSAPTPNLKKCLSPMQPETMGVLWGQLYGSRTPRWGPQ